MLLVKAKFVLVYALHSLEYVLDLARFRVFMPNIYIYIYKHGIVEQVDQVTGEIRKCFEQKKSYLKNRKLRIKYNEYVTRDYDIMAGVPQGSVLGQTLYQIFTADLPTSDRKIFSRF